MINKTCFILLFSVTIIYASDFKNNSNDNNTTKSQKDFYKEKNDETKKVIEQFMKKYSRVSKGC